MIENYSLEIDFLPVGDGAKSGDAIALRFGLYKDGVWDNQKVVVIDGGNLVSGNALVKHVKEVYKTNKVDRVILTHPDADHASGLRPVIEQLEVDRIWMHRPWNHWADLKDSIVDGRITKKSFTERVRENYQYAHDIEKIANENKVKIVSPHQGLTYSFGDTAAITVLGPSKELYLSLVQATGKTPDMAIFESARTATFSADAKTKRVREDLNFETENLVDTDHPTSPENDMSLILLITIGKARILLTGDAGTQGMYKAIYYATEQKLSLKNLDIFDIPHHGSRRNLSKGNLNYISAKYSVVSCSKLGSPKHPSPIVINSMIRRGMTPYKTQGSLLSFRFGNAPSREGYSTAVPLTFTSIVEIPD